MVKAILVMDMPESCLDCDVYNADLDVCQPANRHFRCLGSANRKPNWCPLKTLPKPIDISGCKTDITKARAQEYNALLAKLSN